MRQAACVLARVLRVGVLDLYRRPGRIRVQALAGLRVFLLAHGVRVQALAGPRGLLLARGLVIGCIWVRATSGLRSRERVPCWCA